MRFTLTTIGALAYIVAPALAGPIWPDGSHWSESAAASEPTHHGIEKRAKPWAQCGGETFHGIQWCTIGYFCADYGSGQYYKYCAPLPKQRSTKVTYATWPASIRPAYLASTPAKTNPYAYMIPALGPNKRDAAPKAEPKAAPEPAPLKLTSKASEEAALKKYEALLQRIKPAFKRDAAPEPRVRPLTAWQKVWNTDDKKLGLSDAPAVTAALWRRDDEVEAEIEAEAESTAAIAA